MPFLVSASKEALLALHFNFWFFQIFVFLGFLLFMQVHNGRLEENESRKYFQQLVDAVAHCHCKGVFHRDLKVKLFFLLNIFLRISLFLHCVVILT